MNEPDEGFDWNDRGTFLRAGISVEVVVLLIGLGLAWLGSSFSFFLGSDH